MLDPLHFFKILIYMGSNMGDLLVVSPVQVHSDIQTQSPFAPWGQKVCVYVELVQGCDRHWWSILVKLCGTSFLSDDATQFLQAPLRSNVVTARTVRLSHTVALTTYHPLHCIRRLWVDIPKVQYYEGLIFQRLQFPNPNPNLEYETSGISSSYRSDSSCEH